MGVKESVAARDVRAPFFYISLTRILELLPGEEKIIRFQQTLTQCYMMAALITDERCVV